MEKACKDYALQHFEAVAATEAFLRWDGPRLASLLESDDPWTLLKTLAIQLKAVTPEQGCSVTITGTFGHFSLNGYAKHWENRYFFKFAPNTAKSPG